MDRKTFAQNIKTKYPEYANIDDDLLVDKMIEKYPVYASQIKEPTFIDNVKKDFIERRTTTQEAQHSDINPFRKLLRTAGQGVGFVTDVAGEAIGSVAKTIAPETTKAVAGVAKSGAELAGNAIAGLASTPAGQATVNKLKELATENPEAVKDIGDVINILSVIPAGKAVSVAGESALKTGAKVLETIAPGVAKTVDITKKAGTLAKDVAIGVKDVAVFAGEGAMRIPGRVATNVAEKKAVREVVRGLPTKIAKDAAMNNVDIPDLKYIYNIPKTQKGPLKTLLKTAQDFEKGISKTDPIEIVGKPILTRVKDLEKAKGTIGKRLGGIAEKLGIVTADEAFPTVLKELRQVKGLNGLKIDEKGILDFSDTVLATVETKADRMAIQSIFTDAIRSGSGKQKHLLRQELFESLGGKKKSLANLTATQEQAYEAIRKGLSDVLDTKNGQYKLVNREYAKVAQPLQDMQKLMKGLDGAPEDILNMKAGLLARRLTSMSGSNPQIRNILKAMDSATKVKGKAQINVENLQDFYNLLDKYYDIAGKTGFQSQIKSGVEKVGGVKDFISQAVGSVAGKTDAVRRKAIEDALNEALLVK